MDTGPVMEVVAAVTTTGSGAATVGDGDAWAACNEFMMANRYVGETSLLPALSDAESLPDMTASNMEASAGDEAGVGACGASWCPTKGTMPGFPSSNGTAFTIFLRTLKQRFCHLGGPA
jgi:hypothetical protein